MGHFPSLASLTLLFSLCSVANTQATPTDLACGVTLDPVGCKESLTGLFRPKGPAAVQIILAAISVSDEHLWKYKPAVNQALAGAPNGKSYSELLTKAQSRTGSAVQILSRQPSPPNAVKEARRFIGESLRFQNVGLTALSNLKETDQPKVLLNKTVVATNNAFSMLSALHLYGDNLSRWTPHKP